MLTALLVTSAATLFESAPFILAATLLVRVPLRWNARIDAYLGCGCGAGPSARSLPAAAATWLVFGPLVAGARLAAALLVDRLHRKRASCDHRSDSAPLCELRLLLPIAAIGSCAVLLLPLLISSNAPPAALFLLGAGAAFVIAPCALGTVGLAATLRAMLPPAAAGFLCVAGIADLRAWIARRESAQSHDAFAYAVAALACAIVAGRGGDGLLHPRLAAALWPCAFAAAYCAVRFREQSSPSLRIAPIVMFAGALASAPVPHYHATETTIADAFAGERVDFTGMLTRTGHAATLVRYAITCCRADAAPIVVRLLHAPPPHLRGWMRASGVLVARGATLQLQTASLTPIDPPNDPFVYR